MPPTERKALPARSSRGARIHRLIGEEAEADEAFWNQDAWREDGDDDDYSTEEEEEDVVDSDFDDEEAPDVEVHDAHEEDDRRRSKRRDTSRTRAYREPSSRSLVAKKLRVATDERTSERRHESTATTPRPLRMDPYEAPQVRASTARKTSASSELRQKILQEAARLADRVTKPSVIKPRQSQQELLVEAVRMEVENTQSLNRLERLEEERRAEQAIAPKTPLTTTMVRYHSRIGMPKTITFLNTEEFPAIFRQTVAKKRARPEERRAVEEPLDEDDDDEQDDEGDDESVNSSDEQDGEDDGSDEPTTEDEPLQGQRTIRKKRG
ncbi:hypothetical protein ATCC90586_008368 [Pythium insidiosum]|nr:hypothetical protein ATCC90586_008368 [Pythium insidiosum]